MPLRRCYLPARNLLPGKRRLIAASDSSPQHLSHGPGNVGEMRNLLDASSPQPQSRSGEEGPAGDGGAGLRGEMGHSHGAASSWDAAAAAADGLDDFFPLPVCYRLPPCVVGAQAIALFTLEKKKKSQCARVKLPANGIFSSTQGLPPSQARVCNRAAQGPSGFTSLPFLVLAWPVALRSSPSFASVPLFN